MERGSAFLDTSVLIAAALSTRGGSFYILTHLHDAYALLINQYVLDETLRVLDRKFAARPDVKRALFLLLGIAHIRILADPPPKTVRRIRRVLNPKDAPILASALDHAQYLITLDEDFLNPTVKDFARQKELMIVTPRDFILRHRRQP